MEAYKNLSGDSGVAAFEIGTDFIQVQFLNGDIYLYNDQSAGKENIEQMKMLALAGAGLNTFISKFIQEGYASKIK